MTVGIATITPIENGVSINQNVSFRCTSNVGLAPVSLSSMEAGLTDRLIENAMSIGNVMYTLPMVTADDNGLVFTCTDGTVNQQSDFTVIVFSKEIMF